MNKSLYIIIFFSTLLLFSPINTDAHNGGRDELGGHFRSSDCVYLLHNPTELASSATNMNELIALIHQNNSNENCKASLSADTVDLEGYSFPGGSGGGVTQQTTSCCTSKCTSCNWFNDRPKIYSDARKVHGRRYGKLQYQWNRL